MPDETQSDPQISTPDQFNDDGFRDYPQTTDIEPATTTAPSVTSEVVPPIGMATETPTQTATKSRKPLIVGAILTAAVIVLGAGSTLVYGLWYQNPDKVIADALLNAVTAKTSLYEGSFSVKNSLTEATVSLTAKQADATGSFDAKVTMLAGGKEYAINGSALIDASSDIYLKVENLGGIAEQIKAQAGAYADPSVISAFDRLITKVDGTWIKISNKDLKEFNDATATSKVCIDETVKKFKDDRPAISEVTDLYQKNPFFIIDKKLGEKDGNIGYRIKGDSKELKVFSENLKTTKIYTSLKDCDKEFVFDPSQFLDLDKPSDKDGVELWVSRWSHQIAKVSFEGTDNEQTTKGVITPAYNKPVNITTPASSITLADLQSDIQALVQGVMPSTMPSSPSGRAATDASSVKKYTMMYWADNGGVYPTLSQLIPSLKEDGDIEVVATVASAAKPSAIGYVVCGVDKGADISYYDSLTQTVKRDTVGDCS